MPVYKSKLKSIADSSGVELGEYYENNSPYTGYVILSKYLSNNGSNEYGLFDNDNITKEYLSRGDGNAVIKSEYAVDLSKIYKKSIGPAGDEPSPYHLACAALGKDIGNDDNYFYHYMDIEDSSDSIIEAGFPFNDNKGGNSIITPYDSSTYSKPVYVNFAVVGMSKAATPYINAGLFLEKNLSGELTDENFYFDYGKQFGGDNGIYEFPGYSGLSTMFAEILWYDAENAWDTSDKINHIISSPVLNAKFGYNNLENIGNNIADKICEKFNNHGVFDYKGDFLNYSINLSSAISNLAITNGKEFYSMVLNEPQYNSNIFTGNESLSAYYNKISIDEIGYLHDSSVTYKIVVPVKHDDNKFYEYELYFGIYDSSTDTTHHGSGINEFNKYLSSYYNDNTTKAKEPIVLDHIDNNTACKDYRLNIDGYTTIRNGSSDSSKYYVVARPAGPFLDTNNSTGNIQKAVIDQIKKRHTSYLTRYEAIGLDSGTFYSKLEACAHPLSTGPKHSDSDNNYKLDSSLVSVVSDTLTTSPVTFNDTSVTKKGMIYVSSITLHFKGNTTDVSNKIKISPANDDAAIEFSLNDASLGKNTSDKTGKPRTSYTISLSREKSVAYIRYNSKSSDNYNALTKLGMTCDICGSHQMVRYNSGNCKCKSYIEHLGGSTASAAASAGIDSQWTLLKLSGVFKIQMSGRDTYSTSINNDTDIILEAVDVEITDETELQVGIKYIKSIADSVKLNSNTHTNINNLYNKLTGQTNFTQTVMKEDHDYTKYNASCVFFNSLCGAKRMNKYKEVYYNDSSVDGVLSHNWSTDYQKKRKISVRANDSSNPVIAIGGYGNALDPSIYVGAAYGKSIASNASFKDYTDSSGNVIDPIVITKNEYNDIQAIEPNSNSTVYKTITNDSSINDGNNLNITFSTSNTLRYSLPKPDVKLALDYKSVEFNGASAWTFTRSMPLNAASAANPHILIYKIEAWIETVDQNGNLIIDEKASAAIAISEIDGDNAHKVYSGRTHTINGKTLLGIDDAVRTKEILNNLYLKYNDNETNIYNAVSTSLPIKLLEPATLPLGENNTDMDFYGGNALNYTVNAYTYDNNNDEAEIIQSMYSKIKRNISNDVQVCLCSYIGADVSIGITYDGKKIIYFGIGFYNNSDLIMPITASFGIDLTFTDSATNETATYPNRISLNEFFPKDSILYMAGKNYKNSIESDENSKIRFVKHTSDESLPLNDPGLKTYDRTGTLSSGNNIQEGEVVNIGAGILKSYDSSSHNEGEIHASSIEISDDGDVTSLYGIFNIYSGEINYISTGSSKITNAGLPDVIASSENEDPSTGAYSNYVKFMNEIAGKCLTKSQYICKFVHCTDKDKNIPYII